MALERAVVNSRENALRLIVEGAGTPYKLANSGALNGIVTSATLYSLIDERGIPDKTQWGTVENVARALGYRIVFERIE